MKEKIIELIKKTSFFKWYRKEFYQLNIRDYNSELLDNEKANDYVRELLISDAPMMISRLGSNELKTLECSYKKLEYTDQLKYVMQNNAGFFPSTADNLDKFSKLTFKSIQNIDLLGIWFNPFENVIANKFCPNAKVTILRNLEPYFAKNPWSSHLKDKTVLVIHPFSTSIEYQYKERESLFKNPEVLPEFILKVYPAIQSLGGNDDYTSWFQALEKMQHDIKAIDFDIAIIGAGAYGLPLASYIKDLGKKAIHLGGSTQMLFGVYGRRWEIHPDFQDIINEHWIKPILDEKPKNASKVENSCYW